MRILLVGATGTIGKAVAAAFDRHEVIGASRSNAAESVDFDNPQSIRDLLERVGRVDAIVSTAGQAAFKPLADLSDDDFELSLRNKLMGQVNLIRYGLDHVADDGSITVTSGVLAQHPEPGSAAVSLVNAGLEAFVCAAALEAPRGIRINAVSPPWVAETLEAIGRSPDDGLPADQVAKAYLRSVEGDKSGEVMRPLGS